jgi:hypothetical protein
MMTSYEHLFIRSATGFEVEASDLSAALGMALVHNDEGVWLNRDLPLNGVVVGGEVHANNYTDPVAAAEEVQAFDGYRTVFAIRVLPRKAADQRAEALKIFEELVARRPATPMLLTHDLDLLVAAYLPDRGVHLFAGQVTVDSEDAATWRPWVTRTASDS